MPKVQLNDLSSLANETSVIATINANNAAIEEGFNNTVSRDGTSPNTLEDDINMNSNRIYNVPLVPLTNADVATKYYVDSLAGILDPDNNAFENLEIDGTLTVNGASDFNSAVNIDAALTADSATITGTLAVVDTLSAENGTFLVSNDKIHFNPAGNAGIELGRTDNIASTPYIDFHSSTDGTNDFDSRIIASGGTTSDGAGAIGVIAASFNPVSNDGVTLGTSSLSWSDLFLASGGVINFNAGNATITHSTGLLTSSVPFSVGTSNAITAGTIELGAASDTTLSRASAGNVNIEGNIIYRAGGTDVPVADGGTGRSSHTEYAVICGGTTSTAAQQSIAGVGTSGQVLTSNGAGALPTFQSAASGVVNVVASGTISSAAQLDIALGSAEMYEIDLMSLLPATDNVQLLARFSQSGSFLSGVADYSWGYTGFAVRTNDTSDSEMQMADQWGNLAAEVGTFTIRIFRPASTSFKKMMTWFGGWHSAAGEQLANQGSAALIANTNAIDGVRFLFSSGNISSGYYAVRSYSFT